MSNHEQTKAEKKSSLLNYVGNFIEKRDNQLRETLGEDGGYPLIDRFDEDSVVITNGEGDFQQINLDKSTDIDYDQLSFDSDPTIEAREGGEQMYKQQVYLRRYQPPTPDPVDIQIQENYLKPRIQRPPIHVYVTPSKNRDEQSTPSPILIQSVPPEPTLSYEETPIFYNKYIPVNYKSPMRQIVIHHHPELPPKPRPVLIEQWLPNKPPPKRITYRHINRDEFIQNEAERKFNRYIEHEKPRATTKIEIIYLPVITLSPEEYEKRSDELTQLTHLRSLRYDPNTLQWRI